MLLGFDLLQKALDDTRVGANLDKLSPAKRPTSFAYPLKFETAPSFTPQMLSLGAPCQQSIHHILIFSYCHILCQYLTPVSTHSCEHDASVCIRIGWQSFWLRSGLPVKHAGEVLGRGSAGEVREGHFNGKPTAAKTPSSGEVTSPDTYWDDSYRHTVDSFVNELEVYQATTPYAGVCSCLS